MKQAYYLKHRERILKRQAERKEECPERQILIKAKQRAAIKNVDFEITIDDILITDECPLLGIPLIISKGHPSQNSPTLDRIIPDLGYVKGNVWVISHKANRIKNNATLPELERIAVNLRNKINE